MSGAAADGAAREARAWRRVLDMVEDWTNDEESVTGFDPIADLRRRSRWWGHHIPTSRPADVVAFGWALADAERQAWLSSDRSVATRAFADRRFLFGDRIVHWVVPLTFAVADGGSLRRELLELGEVLRPAPAPTGSEGLHPPGEDSYGPTGVRLGVELGPPERWQELAASHPGTARLWLDLARRAGG